MYTPPKKLGMPMGLNEKVHTIPLSYTSALLHRCCFSYCIGKLMYNTYAYTTKETWNVYGTKSKSTHHPSIIYVPLSSACVAFHIFVGKLV